jgi:hypothetical protein
MLDIADTLKIYPTWQKAKKYTAKSFLKESNLIKDISLGTSFFVDINNQDRDKKMLKYCREDLGVKYLRLGIRLNQYENQDYSKINLQRHLQTINYALDLGYKITLNIGPFKTFGWNETFLPDQFYQDFNLKKEIKNNLRKTPKCLDCSLAILENILKELKKEYGENLPFRAVQLDNEAFNSLGDPSLILDQEYVKDTIKLYQSYFKNSKPKLLLNSAGRLDIHKNIELIKEFTDQDFILGLDYYYTNSIVEKFGFIKKIIDGHTFASPFDPSISKIQKLSKKLGFELEITEAQFETWNDITDPGSKLDHFIFLLLRCSSFLKNNQEKIINLWNLDTFLTRYDESHADEKEILELIREVNSER